MSKRKTKRKPKTLDELKALVIGHPRVTFRDAQNNALTGVAYSVRREKSGKDDTFIILIKDVVGRTSLMPFHVNSRRVLF